MTVKFRIPGWAKRVYVNGKEINATAILDGPIVLAAVEEDGKDFSLNGYSPDEMLTPFVERTYDTYPWQQTSYYSKFDNGKTLFLPLYEITDETYTIYVSKN